MHAFDDGIGRPNVSSPDDFRAPASSFEIEGTGAVLRSAEIARGSGNVIAEPDRRVLWLTLL